MRHALVLLVTALALACAACHTRNTQTARSTQGRPRPCTWPDLKPDPQNLNFANGSVGAAPPGWLLGPEASMPTNQPVFEAKIVPADQCHGGQQCATVRSLRSDRAIPVAFLYQDLAATPHRGHALTYRAYVRVQPGSVARLYVRVHRKDCSTIFRDDMGNHPIKSGDWAAYQVTAPMTPDAFHIEFGLQLIGQGAAWIDQISVQFAPIR